MFLKRRIKLTFTTEVFAIYKVAIYASCCGGIFQLCPLFRTQSHIDNDLEGNHHKLTPQITFTFTHINRDMIKPLNVNQQLRKYFSFGNHIYFFKTFQKYT